MLGRVELAEKAVCDGKTWKSLCEQLELLVGIRRAAYSDERAHPLLADARLFRRRLGGGFQQRRRLRIASAFVEPQPGIVEHIRIVRLGFGRALEIGQ